MPRTAAVGRGARERKVQAMYTIRTLNKISDIVHTRLDAQRYTVSDAAEQYEGVLVRSANMHEMTLSPRLLAIARAGAGYNNIPVERCSEQGIAVFNTPGANANAVKELVMCGLLLAGRQVIAGAQWLGGVDGDLPAETYEKEVEKGKSHFSGPELQGKTLGVVGLGAIGVMVANAALGMGMRVLGYDPFLSVEAAWKLSRAVTHADSLETVWRECDYITLHLPLNDSTRGMVGKQQLAAMKQNAVLLNFARGGLVDEDAVFDALDCGHLRHYVTDFPTARLVRHPSVIATPHLGASTPESEENCAAMAAEELRAYLEDGNVRNAVNLPRCELPRSGGVRCAIFHRNVPNMVGQITAKLAESNHNIEHMVNSSRGEWAYTLLELSGRPDDDCVKKLGDIGGVVRVRVL